MIPLITTIFLIGYATIVFEEQIRISKTASALVTGVLCWTAYILSTNNIKLIDSQLIHHFSDASQILFFLLGVMTIVEVMGHGYGKN